ncbi:NAD(P)/FAD-dependent oxidoreductase [Clostridium algidicarnis]|uniref:Nitrite reductase (NADH) large subunit n=1 Tax=Clostridium algidicarnis DSM 15099 TaxID=1121295 RepID=A0A2S6G0E5_9CLOT|nr:FAD-dependent oxidoreductase [Clostridium algidicarnis]PPK49399.1 nitrite reductase (NADH) large subunit [Clostridium algidicarnis DSM 15099]
MNKGYVIIGSGISAISAAKAIRDKDKSGSISIYGEESMMPYLRIKLSKDLFKDLNNDKILLKKQQWYEENNISFFKDTRILKIDVENKILMSSKGENISYDKLLIATGSRNRRLPIIGSDKEGVFTLRNVLDANNIKDYLKEKHNVVHIGGGVQGLETAWTLHSNGKEVFIVEAGKRLMPRLLDERASSILKEKIENTGVKFICDTRVDEILGHKKVEAVSINEKQVIPCNSVIYSIGMIPNIEIVKDTKIKTNKGIVVNDNMETSIKDVYAAGDVAEFKGNIEGLWMKATEQGTVAGSNMAEDNVIYKNAVPVTVFNAFNTSLFSMGDVSYGSYDNSISEEVDGKYIKIFIKDNSIVGAISIGDASISRTVKTCIEDGLSIDGIDLDTITIKELISQMQKSIKS